MTPSIDGISVPISVRTLIHDLPVPAAVVDMEGQAVLWNATAETLLPPPLRRGETSYPLFSLASQPWFEAVREQTLHEGSVSNIEWHVRGVGGVRKNLKLFTTAIRDGDEANALLVFFEDMTRRERNTVRLARRVRTRRRALYRLPVPLVVHRRGMIVYANVAAADLFEVAHPRELIGLGLCRLFRPASGSADAAKMPNVIMRGSVTGDSGVVRDVEIQATPLGRGPLAVTQVVFREINGVVEPATLRRSEERLRGLSETIRDLGLVMLDAVGFVTSWNGGAEQVTGFRAEEIVGRDLSPIYTNESRSAEANHQALQNAIKSGRHEEEGWRMRRDGTRFWCHMTVSALFDANRRIDGFAVVLRDTTAQRAGGEAARRTEDQLRQAQRMEAIGRLAGGIAHDFNNLLTAIQGHVQFLIDALPANHSAATDAAEIKKAAERAAALTGQLLAFSRRQALQTKIMDLNTVIGEMEKLLRRVIGEDLEVVTRLAEDLGPIRADPGQIEQVLMNLVVNARDAMPDGGRVVIQTSNVELDADYAEHRLDVGAGPYVLLTVSDTGIGMDRETQSHIFEPFFTTKPPGKGTGLGLATVYGIVKQSGGHVYVYSEPGSGTTFKVYLPIVAETGEVLQGAPRMRDMARAGETVLLVEDENAVRGLARRILESRGYRVFEASTGEEALRVAALDSTPIHLLLTDVVMPDMGGRTLWEQLVMLRPDLRVVFMSGYSGYDVERLGALPNGATFLEKPFTPDALASMIRTTLDQHE